MIKITNRFMKRYYPKISERLSQMYSENPSPEQPVSNEFYNEMDKILCPENQIRHFHFKKKTLKLTRRIVATAFALMLILITISAPTSQAKDHFFTSVKKSAGTFHFFHYHHVLTGKEEYATLHWIPEGYTLVPEESDPKTHSFSYRNSQKKELVFIQWRITDNSSIMMADDYQKQYLIHLYGDDIYISYSKEDHLWDATWYHKNVLCSLYGTGIDEYQLLYMLLNLQY